MSHLQLHALVHALEFFFAAPTLVAEPDLGSPSAAAIEPSATTEPTLDPLVIRLELDLSKLPPEDAEYFGRDIRVAIDPLLAREGVVLAETADHRMVIHVELLDPEALDYAVELELLPEGRPTVVPAERLYCRICAQVEVVEQVAQGLSPAIAALRAATRPTLTATVPAELPAVDEPQSLALPEPDAPTVATIPVPDGRESPRPLTATLGVRWLGPVGIIGIVLAVGGTATVAVGTVVLRRALLADFPSVQGDSMRLGWPLYGTGLAVASVGGAMLAADVTALRERRARRLAAQASLTSKHVGLVLSGRF